MPSLVQLWIHPSQLPGQVRRDLLESLRSRNLNHKFLYDGIKQTRKWLALHEACSPSRADPGCAALYDRAFRSAAMRLMPGDVHLVSLGCGGGQKDTRCLHVLKESGKVLSYTPVDVSTAMVLTAWQCATASLPGLACTPVVCDLATAADFESALDRLAQSHSQRLVSFLSMIPNFEPDLILPRLASLVRPGDRLLFSANLAPGADYAEGMRRILPLYDNALTRDWLLGFLLDLGVDTADGDLIFTVEDTELGLKRIAAHFRFSRTRDIRLDLETFLFHPGDSLRLFFSYRHTLALISSLLPKHGLEIVEHWVTNSGEEVVLLLRSAATGA